MTTRRIARGMVSYGRSLAHGFRPQRPTRDTVRAPAVVVLDHALNVRWSHVGRRIGDYPPLPQVLERSPGSLVSLDSALLTARLTTTAGGFHRRSICARRQHRQRPAPPPPTGGPDGG